MGNVCTQGPAERETPDHPSFQSLLQEQKAKENTPQKEAEKQKTLSNSLGLSAKTANTEETAGSSAERSRQDEFLTAEKSKKLEAAAAELEASALFEENPSNGQP